MKPKNDSVTIKSFVPMIDFVNHKVNIPPNPAPAKEKQREKIE